MTCRPSTLDPRLSISALALMLCLALSASAAVPGYFLEIESYDIEAELVPDEDLLNVTATLEIVNHTFYPLEVMDLYFNGNAQIHSATINGGETPFENIGGRGDEIRRLVFSIEPPIPVGDTLTVRVDYSVAYFERGLGVSIEPGASHVLVEARWTPFLHDFRSDYGADYAPAHVVVTVPADETVVMPGNLLSQELTPEGARFEWESALTVLPTIVSGRYRTVEVDTDAGHAVGYLFENMSGAEETAMRALLERALEINAYYTELFGPLPDLPMRIVAVERRGGYGLPQCLLLHRGTFGFEGEISEGTFNFLAHEIAHSWFPGLLRPRERATGMATEAMATHCAALATEHLLGPEAGRAAWANCQQIYSRLESDVPLLDQTFQSHTYSISTYHKGAYWWRTLERRLGRDRMIGLLRTYAQEHALESVPFVDLFTWIDEQTPDEDLRPLYRWYLDTTELANVGIVGEPRIRARGDGAEVEVTIDTEGFEGLPVDVDLILADGSTVREGLAIGDGEQTLTWQVPSPPRRIVLDPDRWLLQSRYRDDRWPRELDGVGYLRVASAAWRRGDFEAGLEPIAQALARQPENPQFLLMAGQLLLGVGDAEGAANHLARALDLCPDEESSITRAWTLVALGRAERALGSRSDARAHWFQVMNTPSTRLAHAEARALMRALDEESAARAHSN